MYLIQAYTLESDDEVSCYYCMRGGVQGYAESYKRGEAVLADAGHPPYDGNANYICLGHLSRETVIMDTENRFEQIDVSDYAKLGRPSVVGKMRYA